jgi:tetratricopeptide (TPR) repeat protein
MAQAREQADTVAFYRSLLAQDPGAASIWVSLAETLFHAGQREAALRAVDSGLAIDAALVQGWLVRGALCKALLRFEDAIAAFEHANRLMPGKAKLLVALGTAHAELGRLLDAEECLRRAVALSPDSVEGHSNLGSIYVRQSRFDLAEAACRRALALSPGLVIAHQNLAGALARTRPEEARLHRDAAYGRQQIFVEAAVQPLRTVLVLCSADAANVPLRGLLPREHCTLINWFIEYAPPGQDAALPRYDFVFNAIGEAEFAIACAAPVERFLAQCRQPVLNQPARVARTGRGDLPVLLAGIPGIVVPPVLRLAPGEDAPQAVRNAGLNLPVILRPLGSHGGEGAELISGWAELEESGAQHAGAYVTAFGEYRSADGLYRKYRVIFVDRVPYAYHLAISQHWLVHYWTADMDTDATRRVEEEHFLEAPATAIGASAMQALADIGARLDLDYAGIDFAILPDGRLLVFEANATMLVHSEDSKMFAYKNPAVQRIRDAFDAMIGTIV